MEGSPDDGNMRNEFLFQHLIAMFQTLAWQQLGKLVNPITGKAEQDLQQARITIDMLRMLREKTAGNLTEGERRILDGVLMELQMNYVDEQQREGTGPEKEESEKAEAVSGAGDRGPEGGKEPEKEGVGKRPGTKGGEGGKKPGAGRSKSKTGKKRADKEKG